jgi:hypothetical protein
MTKRGTVGRQYGGQRKVSPEATAIVARMTRTMGEESVTRLLHTSHVVIGKVLDGMPVKNSTADNIETRVAGLRQKGAA